MPVIQTLSYVNRHSQLRTCSEIASPSRRERIRNDRVGVGTSSATWLRGGTLQIRMTLSRAKARDSWSNLDTLIYSLLERCGPMMMTSRQDKKISLLSSENPSVSRDTNVLPSENTLSYHVKEGRTTKPSRDVPIQKASVPR